MISIKPKNCSNNLSDIESICSYELKFNLLKKNKEKKIPQKIYKKDSDSCLHYYYHIPLKNVKINYDKKNSIDHQIIYMVCYYDREKQFQHMIENKKFGSENMCISQWNYLNLFLIPFPMNMYIYTDSVNIVLMNEKFCVMNRMKQEYCDYVWKSICIYLKHTFKHPFSNHIDNSPIEEINQYKMDNVMDLNNQQMISRYDFMLQDMSRENVSRSESRKVNSFKKKDDYQKMMDSCLSKPDHLFSKTLKHQGDEKTSELQLNANNIAQIHLENMGQDVEMIKSSSKKKINKKSLPLEDDTTTLDDLTSNGDKHDEDETTNDQHSHDQTSHDDMSHDDASHNDLDDDDDIEVDEDDIEVDDDIEIEEEDEDDVEDD